MTLTVYHLHFAQSDRIIWLCEELAAAIPTFQYELKIYDRGLPDSEGKRTLLSLHPSGTAPTIVDSNVDPPLVLAESQAILQYILDVYAQAHFQVTVLDGPVKYANYLYWMSFANGSFQANLTACLTAESVVETYGLNATEAREKVFVVKYFQDKITNHLKQYEAQLSKTRYLAGEEFSAVDMMNVYGLTTMRAIYPVDISSYPCLTRYLRDITGRVAYRRMMERAEDGMPPLVMEKVPRFDFGVLLSMKSWREVEGIGGEGVAKQ